MTATMTYLVIHMCMFTRNGETLYYLPTSELNILSGAYHEFLKQNAALNLDPSKVGYIIKLSSDGCKQDDPANAPTFVPPPRPTFGPIIQSK